MEEPKVLFGAHSAAADALSNVCRRVELEISTPQQLKAAKDARAMARNLRSEIEAHRKGLVEPHLVAMRQINSTGQAVTDAVLALESPVVGAIREFEAKVAGSKEAAAKEREDAVRAIMEDDSLTMDERVAKVSELSSKRV